MSHPRVKKKSVFITHGALLLGSDHSHSELEDEAVCKYYLALQSAAKPSNRRNLSQQSLERLCKVIYQYSGTCSSGIKADN